jgi:mannose/fructose/N-acetylgalactosamine-specific phosphotransferase system component IIB
VFVPIVLFRVDERLIHGQVVVGWGERLQIERIIVVDDELNASPWEQELYCLGVPPGVESTFTSVGAALEKLPAWRDDPRRTIILLRDLDTLGRLADAGGLHGEDVNLGGMHSAPGRTGVLAYLYLSADEKDKLRQIADQGVSIAARDLPGSRAVPLEELLGDS